MSITAFQAVSRLARRHAGKGMAELSSAELLAAVEALNGGLVELFRLLPDSYREQDMVFTGLPRAGVSCQMVEGDAQLAAAAFGTEEAGRTIIFDSGGDGAWHQIAGEDRLRLPWLGTTGTHTATIYPDALTGNGGPVERLLEDPVMVESGGTRRRLRLLTEQDRLGWLGESPKIGTPEYYYLQPAGFADAGASVAWLRLWPIPAVSVRLVARAMWWPRRLLVPDVQGGAVALPVPDAATEDFLDLCGVRLAVIPGWQAIPFQAASNAAAAATGRVRSWTSQIFKPSNRVRTPFGW